MDSGISNQYREKGVEGFYREEGARYRNPHEFVIECLLTQAIEKLGFKAGKVLDLACGSGEVTLALEKLGMSDVDGVDPFTYAAFEERTGKVAERYRFEEVAAGCLAERRYDLIVCSFAMHLLEVSRLPALCDALSRISPRLVILTPHKRPLIKSQWGWELDFELLEDRVRARAYASTFGQWH